MMLHVHIVQGFTEYFQTHDYHHTSVLFPQPPDCSAEAPSTSCIGGFHPLSMNLVRACHEDS